MTLQDLKNRKSYIIAKITRIAGEENVKPYMNLMLLIQQGGFEGTVYDLVQTVDFQLRGRSRKTSRVAESYGKAVEEGRMEAYDIKKDLH